MKNWHGIMKIEKFQYLSKNKEILYEENNINNLIHLVGEELILKILFAGLPVPTNYFIGLDSRSSLDPTLGIGSVFGYEPNQNSYERQQIKSDNFSIIVGSSRHRQANSPTVLFKAIGGSWGPVKNIFLTTNLGYGTNSILISSAALSREITVRDGEIITMRMAMALSNC
jgi:hypothetical protein